MLTESRIPRALSRGGRRQTFLWLAMVVLLALVMVISLLHRHQLDALQRQLVATQESFAGLSEASVRHLQQLDERTADLTRLQGRVLGMSVQLDGIPEQLERLDALANTVQGVQDQQQALRQQLAQLLGRLEAQSQAVEQTALVLDRAQQRMQAGLEQQESVQQAVLADVDALRAVLAGLEEQAQLDRRQLEQLAGQLAVREAQWAAMEVLPERHAQLQQSLLKLAQQLDSGRKERKEQAEEMAAFRLQVTRAQNRLQQRLDTLQR